ncbi:MAG: flavin reductase family protein [Granulosicoccaceae bacterium]
MANQAQSGIDIKSFRHALGKFATGVTVISSHEADGTPRGFTANSFTSVSLDPPLVLVCIAKSAASFDVFCGASHFSINVLGDDQTEVSNLFASQRADKFTVANRHAAQSGAPLINDALAWFDCAQHSIVEAGDHVILMGQVEDFGAREGQPLGYFAGNYFNLEVEQTLVDAIAGNAHTVMGALFQQNDTVLLREDENTGLLSIPEIGRQGGDVSLQILTQRYNAAPLLGVIDVVYAVFEDKQENSVTIYYRGHATGSAPAGYRFFPIKAIPWERISYEPLKIMLKRFDKEYGTNQFAIYMGDEVEGVLHALK